jgi:hypothetical protein
METICRFNRRKECVFETSKPLRSPLKKYVVDGHVVALVYEKNARLENAIPYEKIMQYPRFYPILARVKNIVGQTVANDKTIIAPKPYKHIINYAYEKR